MKRELCAVTAAVLFASAPAVAQTTQPTVPPAVTNVIEGIVTKLGGDAAAPYGLDPNHSRGTVTYFKRFDLQIRMPLSTYRDIHLHQGTVINPRGASIEDGQVLDVLGHANPDGSLNADTITIVH
jgi:opacity protein-like surface antigen